MQARPQPLLLAFFALVTLLGLGACSGQDPQTAPDPLGARPVVVAVSPTDAVGLPTDPVVFSVDATNTPTAYHWEFGGSANPASSTLARPMVRLDRPGEFVGRVTASNASGSSEPYQFSFRTTAATLPPVITAVEPTGEPIGPLGADITFIAAATYSPTSWSWTFLGGVAPPTSTDRTPSVTLTTAGVFQGTVIATNSAGSSAPFLFALQIVDSTVAPRIIAVSPMGQAGIEGAATEFSAFVTSPLDTWSWDFGGGADPNTSTDPQPQVTLGVPGTYTGSVSGTNSAGSAQALAFEYEVIANTPPEILAILPSEPLAGASGHSVTLRAISSVSLTAWEWDFGGGATTPSADVPAPRIQLASPVFPPAGTPIEQRTYQTYTGTMRGGNAAGASEAHPFEIHIFRDLGVPRVIWVDHPDPLRVEETTTFEARAAGLWGEFQWDLGPNATPQTVVTTTRTTPDIAFAAAGTFQGTVTPVGVSGTGLPFNFTYTVEPEYVQLRIVAPAYFDLCPSDPMQVILEIDAPTMDGVTWQWNLPPGIQLDDPDSLTPTITGTVPGIFPATVQAFRGGGASEIVERSIQVYDTGPDCMHYQPLVGVSGTLDEPASALAFHEGRPLFVVQRGDGYVIGAAQSANPQTQAEWATQTIPVDDTVYIHDLQLAVAGGYAAFSITTNGTNFFYVYTDTNTNPVDGSAWTATEPGADYAWSTVQPPDSFTRHPVLGSDGERLFATYAAPWTGGGDIGFARAAQVPPLLNTDWEVLSLVDPNAGHVQVDAAPLAFRNGTVAFAWEERFSLEPGIGFAIAPNIPELQPEQVFMRSLVHWETTNFAYLKWLGLTATPNGYFLATREGEGQDEIYIRGPLTAVTDGSAHWATYPLTLPPFVSQTSLGGLEMIGDRLALFVHDLQDSIPVNHLALSDTFSPVTPESWRFTQISRGGSPTTAMWPLASDGDRLWTIWSEDVDPIQNVEAIRIGTPLGP